MDSNEPVRSFTRRQEKKLLEAAAALAREQFANPDRSGCPSERTLRLLASRDPSVESEPPLVDHIGTCSDCFSDYSRYRRDYKFRIRLYFAVPAAVFASVLVAWIFVPRSSPPTPPQVERVEVPPAPRAEVAMTLDLRNRATVRGETPAKGTGSIPRLAREPLDLSIQLPVGSENGRYELNLIDGKREVLRRATGQAALKSFIQVLSIKLDCSDLPAGTYTLRLRRGQGSWREFGVELE